MLALRALAVGHFPPMLEIERLRLEETKRSYIEPVTKEIEAFVYSERPCERPVPNHSVTIIKNHSGEKFYSFNR